MSSIVSQFSLFFILYSSFLLCVRFAGLADPLFRQILWPIAGSTYLLANSDYLSSRDGLLFFLSLAWVCALTIWSTPKNVPAKYISSGRVLFVSKCLSWFFLLFSFFDLYFNLNPDSSAFLSGTFDIRGDLRYPYLRFLNDAFSISALPLFFIFRNHRSFFYSRLIILGQVISMLPGVLIFGKGLFFGFFYLLLNYIFFENLIRGISPSPIISGHIIKKKHLRALLLGSFIIGLLLLLTLFLIGSVLGLDIEQSLELLSFRIFDSSYDMAFNIIRSTSVHLGFNSPSSEFGSVIELWLKSIAKAFGVSYIHDTIPKYLEPLLYGRSTYGISSPNSNLYVELTALHGAFAGSFLLLFITGLGVWLRRRYMRSALIDINFLLFIPMITSGPMFCFQSAQPFFTSYIPFVVTVLGLSLVYNVLIHTKLLHSSSN